MMSCMRRHGAVVAHESSMEAARKQDGSSREAACKESRRSGAAEKEEVELHRDLTMKGGLKTFF